MTQKEVYLTQEGLTKLEAELENLRTVRRQEVADKIHKAIELGGTDNNAEYEEAKNEQAFTEGRILTLEKTIQNASIINSDCHDTSKVVLGCTVTVKNQEGKQETYTIVGKEEADPLKGKISNESPVGSALLGRKKKEKVTVSTPAGTLKLEIIEVG
ncbi:MAG: transcription elongation factor GreA [Dehalococcoidia bacterium]|nr:transcription elongation factor GreA [Dehalococcoidia bacterium]MDZ4246073.1 transcription elongation factor GreA [Dehalococcoidia bacterium]